MTEWTLVARPGGFYERWPGIFKLVINSGLLFSADRTQWRIRRRADVLLVPVTRPVLSQGVFGREGRADLPLPADLRTE